MCDYSLHHVASRLARVGDKLVTTKFANSPTRGFAAVGEPNVAVCLLPGTELKFAREVLYNDPPVPMIGRLMAKSSGHITARFRQINAGQPAAHHDALEFPDGAIVLVTRLCSGQHATVLQLPAAPKTRSEAAEQKRAEYV